MTEPNAPPSRPPEGHPAARYGEDAKSHVTHQDAKVLNLRRRPRQYGGQERTI